MYSRTLRLFVTIMLLICTKEAGVLGKGTVIAGTEIRTELETVVKDVLTSLIEVRNHADAQHRIRRYSIEAKSAAILEAAIQNEISVHQMRASGGRTDTVYIDVTVDSFILDAGSARVGVTVTFEELLYGIDTEDSSNGIVNSGRRESYVFHFIETGKGWSIANIQACGYYGIIPGCSLIEDIESNVSQFEGTGILDEMSEAEQSADTEIRISSKALEIDKKAVVKYATRYAIYSNPDYVCKAYADSVNFVSQALFNGGLPIHNKKSFPERLDAWWYRRSNSPYDRSKDRMSSSWMLPVQFRHFLNLVHKMPGGMTVTEDWTDRHVCWEPGDIVTVGSAPGCNELPRYVMVITGGKRGRWPLVSAHSGNKLNVPLNELVSEWDGVHYNELWWRYHFKAKGSNANEVKCKD